jgi:hypothetical protein
LITRSLLTFAALAIGLVALPSGARAQDDDYRGGALDARQHGYQHGYRDGYAYGRDTRGHNATLDLDRDMVQDADRGYRAFMGSRDAFRDGYREGYRHGAEDGYKGVNSRLEETYRWRDRDFNPDTARMDRSTAVYSEKHWDYEDVASDIGYRDGVNAGLKDFREHHSFRPQEHDSWKDADHGYNNSFGRKEEYKRAYRLAYERGYKDGFGVRR